MLAAFRLSGNSHTEHEHATEVLEPEWHDLILRERSRDSLDVQRL